MSKGITALLRHRERMRNDPEYKEKIRQHHREMAKRLSERRNRHCKHEGCEKLLNYLTKGDFCSTHVGDAKSEKRLKRNEVEE